MTCEKSISEVAELLHSGEHSKKELEAGLTEMLKSCAVGGKGKRMKGARKPSQYNLHMSSCLKALKGQPGEHKNKFKKCVDSWNSKKGG